MTADKETTLRQALQKVQKDRRVVLQWVPAHCGIPGNEAADKLAKAGADQEQHESNLTYQERRTIIKNIMKPKVEEDSYHKLSREDQVIILRLRSGHNRLNHHMATKLKLVPSPLCTCGSDNQTAEHVLQTCPTLENDRKTIWRTEVPLKQKLYGTTRELERTAHFIRRTGLTL